MMRLFLACCAPLLLAACSSVPVQYYTLLAPAAPAAATAPTSYDLDVLPITLPAQVDQQPLVIRTGDGEMAVLDNRQWIAPPADELRRALAIALEQRLGARDVHGLPPDAARPRYRIQVAVDRFEATPGSASLLHATWRITGPRQAVVQCSSNERAPLPDARYATLVAGQQRNIAHLATAIAAALGRLAASGAARCDS